MNSKVKDRNQNIKVFVRVRPRNSLELRSHVVVDCVNNKEITVKDKGQSKAFNFDRVFGPESRQVDVYKIVVSPLINEVLQGYNCTVFAYGQTGTGKTFTMVGDRSKDLVGGWENDPLCGIVPRTLDHLFDELKVRAEEFTVRVSFLELYNEELCDLLARGDDDTKSLRLFEDAMKKGSVIVSGLEERTVYEKNDVYPILEAGNLRRQTAPTLMNAQSSRSHTIFTITVHVKVTTPEGEELFKTGKLNLVDLAGSENIGRSGAVDMRAREAGNINQSLLTLGRVITSLVERTPHVPYRESKLTRILQDSLGGRTKTSIIATISPALCNIEETLSTCDYAHRARNITNKPEINQKTSKQVLLKNYTDEIERLRRDLNAAREKHGVYLMNEDYTSMLGQIDSLNKELVNKIQLLKVREDEFMKQEDIMQSLNMNLYETKNELNAKADLLRVKTEALEEKDSALQELNQQAQILLKTASEATEDSSRLHDRLDKARLVHKHNQAAVERFRDVFCTNLTSMKNTTETFRSGILNQIADVKDTCESKSSECREHEDEVKGVIEDHHRQLQEQSSSLCDQFDQQMKNTQPALRSQRDEVMNIASEFTNIAKNHCNKMIEALEHRNSDWESVSKHLSEGTVGQQEISSELRGAEIKIDECEGSIANMSTAITETTRTDENNFNELHRRKVDLISSIASLRTEQDELFVKLKELRDAELAKNLELAKLDEEIRLAQQASMISIVKHISDIGVENTRNVEEIRKHVIAALGRNQSLLNSSIEMTPIISKARSADVEATSAANESHAAAISSLEDRSSRLCAMQEDVENSLVSYATQCQDLFNASKATLASLQTSATTLAENETRRIAESDAKIQGMIRHCESEITQFCDQAFASIHDRCNEIKTHFKDELLRDEKTGQTPQRKDFVYPKRLVPLNRQQREDAENIPPNETSKVLQLE